MCSFASHMGQDIVLTAHPWIGVIAYRSADSRENDRTKVAFCADGFRAPRACRLNGNPARRPTPLSRYSRALLTHSPPATELRCPLLSRHQTAQRGCYIRVEHQHGKHRSLSDRLNLRPLACSRRSHRMRQHTELRAGAFTPSRSLNPRPPASATVRRRRRTEARHLPEYRIFNRRTGRLPTGDDSDFSGFAGVSPRHFDQACNMEYICVWAAEGLLPRRLTAKGRSQVVPD